MSIITLDFETYYSKQFCLKKYGTENYIRNELFEVIGVAVKKDEEPTKSFTGPKNEIASFLSDYDLENSYVLAHNTSFDGAILEWVFERTAKRYMDTLSMARGYLGLAASLSLANLAKHFGVGFKGHEVVLAEGLTREAFPKAQLEEYMAYCRNDVNLTYEIYKIMRPCIHNMEMLIIDMTIRMFVNPVLQLDRGVLELNLAAVIKRKEELLEAIGGESYRDVLMSNQKFAELLRSFDVEPPMKISPRTQKETFAFSKSDPGFKALLEHENVDVQAIAAARIGIKSTQEETRTIRLLGVEERGACPVMTYYFGARTGRPTGGDRVNMLNLPSKGRLREALLAPKGHFLLDSDSSQIEPRLLAWIAGEQELLDGFADNTRDIYCEYGSKMFGYRVDKINTPRERQIAKAQVLGMGYGMGAAKFKLYLAGQNPSVIVTEEEAAEAVAYYRGYYKQINKYWKLVRAALDRVVSGKPAVIPGAIDLYWDSDGIDLIGRQKIKFPGLRKLSEKEANKYLVLKPGDLVYDTRKGPNRVYYSLVVENIIQSLARIAIFDKAVQVHQETPVVLCVYDEIVTVVPEDKIDYHKNRIESIMISAPKWAPDLPLACETVWGRNYAECA